ncbi:MAG: hypothetical protein IJG23_03825, partial [Clostridia bacterium]|nr:hypothetical protein [Clostridia bacterium]
MKAKSIFKRELSLVLVVLILLSCWVFVAPTKSEAATAGTYDFKFVIYDNENGCNCTSNHTIKYKYKSNNGTGTESGEQTLTGSKNMKSSGESNGWSTTASNVGGFITYVYAYSDCDTGSYPDYCCKVYVKASTSSSWTAIVDWKFWHKDNWGANNGSGSKSQSDWSGKMPTATSVGFTGGSTAITLPTNGNNATSTYSASVYDQYGAVWYQDVSSYSTTTSHTGYSFNTSSHVATLTSSANAASNWSYTIKATFGSLSNTRSCTVTVFKYLVQFYDDDGTTTIGTQQTVNYGGSATAPADPTKTNTNKYTYSFSSWVGTYQNLTSGAQTKSVTASYSSTLFPYTIIYKNGDGTEATRNSNVAYDGTITLPGTSSITKNSTPQYTYTFGGKWSATDGGSDAQISNSTTPQAIGLTRSNSTKTYYPIFTATTRSYNIPFVSADTNYPDDSTKTTTETKSTTYGNRPAPTTPATIDTNLWTRTFRAWLNSGTEYTTAELPKVETSASTYSIPTYTAQYDESYYNYAITYKNGDGTNALTNNIRYNQTLALPGSGTITKASTAEYDFTFVGWTATQQSPDYNESGSSAAIVSISNSTKPSDIGLTKSNLTKTYYPFFRATRRSYDIVFSYKNASNTMVSSDPQTIAYGQTATAPSIPLSVVTTETTFTFTGWSPSYTQGTTTVTGAQTYVAQYSDTPTPHLISFNYVNPADVKGEPLTSSGNVPYGVRPTPPEVPDYEDEVGIHEFTSWSPNVALVIGPATYTANYQIKSYTNYTVTFNNATNGAASVKSDYHWGDQIIVPTATKAADVQYTYTFDHWEDTNGQTVTPAATVSGNVTYTAVFSHTTNKYTITYKRTLPNGTVTDIKTTAAYDYGTVPSSITGTDAVPNLADYPMAADDTNHYVAGWTNEQSKTLDDAILGNTIFTITYTPVAHTWVSEEGVVKKVATCTETGIREKTCSVCSKSVESTIVIDPTNHDPVLHTVTPDEMSIDDVSSGASSTGYVYFQCSRCSNVWAAEYNATDKEYDVKDFESNPTGTPESNIDEIVSTSEEIPAPSFNMYYDDGGIYDTEEAIMVYDYAFRGASLKKMHTPYEDGNTLQDIRFSGSVSIPVGVSTQASAYNKLNKDSALVDNVIIDFGFVYTQDSYMGRNPANLTLDNVRDDPKYLSMSVVDNNASNGTYDVATDNWVGVTYH